MSWDIVNPAGRPSGWNDGMLAPAGGRILFVAGQTGRDGSGEVPALDLPAQWRNALRNVLTIVEAAGGSAADIGRMTVYVTDVADYRHARGELAAVWREVMGKHYPAMALVQVTALVDTNATVEIEATAVVPAWKR